jgi:hypothetical protein
MAINNERFYVDGGITHLVVHNYPCFELAC